MRKYVLTPSAKADLEEIFDYISDDNFDAAAKVVAGLEKRCRMLAERPLLGHTQPNLLPEQFRVFPVSSYLIIYRPETKPLQIIRFWHAARGVPDLF
jgi:addiction module RelE/StbE family toxin